MSVTQEFGGAVTTGKGHALQGQFFAGGNITVGGYSSEPSGHQKLLRRLDFGGRRAREAQVDDVNVKEESFEWIWTSPFPGWLQSRHPIFQVIGKPASGKSTLINYLAKSSTTSSWLSKSNDATWTVAHFFFDFREGLNISNSVKGLLLSLLFDMVEKLPELVTLIVEKGSRWQNIEYLHHWPGTQIRKVFRSCLQQFLRKPGNSLCLFIDGLDEFEGDMLDLVNLFKDITAAGQVKIILASRPNETLEHSLDQSASIKVQDYNLDGIMKFVQLTLTDSGIDRNDMNAVELFKFSATIAERSEGVFLWASFTTYELIRLWIGGHRSAEILQKKLDELPASLEEIWYRILDRLDPDEKLQANIILQLICFARTSLTLRELCVAIDHVNGAPYVAVSDNPTSTKDYEVRGKEIKRVAGGLVEFVSSDPVANRGQHPVASVKQIVRVKLVHKTVQTYLDKLGWSQLSTETSNPHLMWLDVCVQRILLCTKYVGMRRAVSSASKNMENETPLLPDVLPRFVLRPQALHASAAIKQQFVPAEFGFDWFYDSWNDASLISQWANKGHFILLPYAIAFFLDYAREVEHKSKKSSHLYLRAAMQPKILSIHQNGHLNVTGGDCGICMKSRSPHPKFHGPEYYNTTAFAAMHGLAHFMEEQICYTMDNPDFENDGRSFGCEKYHRQRKIILSKADLLLGAALFAAQANTCAVTIPRGLDAFVINSALKFDRAYHPSFMKIVIEDGRVEAFARLLDHAGVVRNPDLVMKVAGMANLSADMLPKIDLCLERGDDINLPFKDVGGILMFFRYQRIPYYQKFDLFRNLIERGARVDVTTSSSRGNGSMNVLDDSWHEYHDSWNFIALTELIPHLIHCGAHPVDEEWWTGTVPTIRDILRLQKLGEAEVAKYQVIVKDAIEHVNNVSSVDRKIHRRRLPTGTKKKDLDVFRKTVKEKLDKIRWGANSDA